MTLSYNTYIHIIAYILSFSFLFKDYVEINPKFVDEFYEEIYDTWNLIDFNKKSHNVEFNGELSRPAFIDK
jgi:hypothetical protein